jgi:hypothetical protein
MSTPVDPLISIGETSVIYFEQKTPNAPDDIPYRNLPTYKIYKLVEKVIRLPVITAMSEITTHFHLPMLENGANATLPTILPSAMSA